MRLLALVVALTLAACGPSASYSAMSDAARLQREVATPDNRAYAAYEVAQGEALLSRARVAAGHAHHDLAVELARMARDAFIQARTVALDNASRKHFRPYRLDWDVPVAP